MIDIQFMFANPIGSFRPNKFKPLKQRDFSKSGFKSAYWACTLCATHGFLNSLGIKVHKSDILIEAKYQKPMNKLCTYGLDQNEVQEIMVNLGLNSETIKTICYTNITKAFNAIKSSIKKSPILVFQDNHCFAILSEIYGNFQILDPDEHVSDFNYLSSFKLKKLIKLDSEIILITTEV